MEGLQARVSRDRLAYVMDFDGSEADAVDEASLLEGGCKPKFTTIEVLRRSLDTGISEIHLFQVGVVAWCEAATRRGRKRGRETRAERARLALSALV